VKISRVSINENKERKRNHRVEVDKIPNAENKAESEQTLTGFVGI